MEEVPVWIIHYGTLRRGIYILESHISCARSSYDHQFCIGFLLYRKSTNFKRIAEKIAAVKSE